MKRVYEESVTADRTGGLLLIQVQVDKIICHFEGIQANPGEDFGLQLAVVQTRARPLAPLAYSYIEEHRNRFGRLGQGFFGGTGILPLSPQGPLRGREGPKKNGYKERNCRYMPGRTLDCTDCGGL